MDRTTPGRGLPPGALAWSLFEGARNPFVVLVTIYVFMPYFSSVVVGDPVRGQQAVATYGQWSGIVVALTAPLLGASVDRIGRRKPLLLALTAVMVPLMAALWFARADHSGLSITGVIVLAAAVNVLFGYSEVLHNSLLVRAAGVRRAHAASGLALVLGNVISVTALLFVLWAFVLPGVVPGWIPRTPLWGLDSRSYQPARIVAPMAAAIFAVGAIPLFLLTPDAPATGLPLTRAFAEGGRALVAMLRSLKGRRDAAVFLASRMLYIDAMTGVLLFAGVYAGGVMHWGVLQLLVYGILLSITAVAGGALGGWLDQALGPKAAVRIEVGAVVLAIVALLGMAPDRILYVWRFDHAAAVWGAPMFRTLPELVYLGLAAAASVFVTASYASSRTLLVRLTPPEESGAFFGLYALSGTATVWIGSALVLVATRATGAQQAGFVALAILMTLGLVGLIFVRGGGRHVGGDGGEALEGALPRGWTAPPASAAP